MKQHNTHPTDNSFQPEPEHTLLSTVRRLSRQALLTILIVLPIHAIAASHSAIGSINYISGGIGLDERKEFQAQANNYNLQLSFAQQKTGSYLADVKVFIKSMKGEPIFEAVSEGPLFYARLPSGTYKVEVVYRGKMQSKKARVAAQRPLQIYFYWPEIPR